MLFVVQPTIADSTSLRQPADHALVLHAGPHAGWRASPLVGPGDHSAADRLCQAMHCRSVDTTRPNSTAPGCGAGCVAAPFRIAGWRAPAPSTLCNTAQA